MSPLRIRILNPKALKLIKGMEELNLISVEQDPVSKVQSYLKLMRRNSAGAPTTKEIAQIVKGVRSKRNARK